MNGIQPGMPMSQMPMSQSVQSDGPDNESPTARRSTADPVAAVLSKDAIHRSGASGHADIREELEAAGVVLGGGGAAWLLTSTYRRWKKATNVTHAGALWR